MRVSENVIDVLFCGKLKHLTRFSLVGIINTLIDFFVFSLLQGVFGFSYGFSQFMGYSCGIANSFILNKNWTFNQENAKKKTAEELMKFVVVNLVTLAITMIAINYLTKNLQVNVYAAKIIVTILAQISNFLLYKLWIFKSNYRDG